MFTDLQFYLEIHILLYFFFYVKLIYISAVQSLHSIKYSGFRYWNNFRTFSIFNGTYSSIFMRNNLLLEA